jgi:hypothetical protein
MLNYVPWEDGNVRRVFRLPMIACAVVACALAQLGYSEPVTLSCTGRTLTYTPDLSRPLQTLEPFQFSVVVDLSRGQLANASIADAHEFELRDAGDAVFFVRDRVIAGREAFEWVSISRVSGRYAHFIAFRDAATGSLESPILMTAAGCAL